MHAAKLAVGRKLTEDDMSEATKNFKTLWARYDKDAVKESFDSWRRGDCTGAEPPKAPATEKPYIPNWAGGNKHAPVTMEELHAHWSKHGWPRNSKVTGANGEFAALLLRTSTSTELQNIFGWHVVLVIKMSHRRGSLPETR